MRVMGEVMGSDAYWAGGVGVLDDKRLSFGDGGGLRVTRDAWWRGAVGAPPERRGKQRPPRRGRAHLTVYRVSLKLPARFLRPLCGMFLHLFIVLLGRGRGEGRPVRGAGGAAARVELWLWLQSPVTVDVLAICFRAVICFPLREMTCGGVDLKRPMFLYPPLQDPNSRSHL